MTIDDFRTALSAVIADNVVTVPFPMGWDDEDEPYHGDDDRSPVTGY